ncbi:hypothetical protein, partial [Streptosporangium sandarakinum]|uniref:hypothetical protein n=1 Tax=Streptosporangium sandarakinum TaxID=1260955 RepID=UPI0033B4EDFB
MTAPLDTEPAAATAAAGPPLERRPPRGVLPNARTELGGAQRSRGKGILATVVQFPQIPRDP